MIISEERYAAAVIHEGIEILEFDDLGCMLNSRDRISAEAEIWLHDVASGQWVDGTQAWYLRSEAGLMPMGSGVRCSKRGTSLTNQSRRTVDV
jgi:hypothetical protein